MSFFDQKSMTDNLMKEIRQLIWACQKKNNKTTKTKQTKTLSGFYFVQSISQVMFALLCFALFCSTIAESKETHQR
jgi:hypothetical protein